MSSDHRWDNKPIRTLTTGNRAFAECKLLCRVSKIGHSAKTALGKEFFVECRALGKELICRVLDSRHRLPRVTVFGHVLLCRVLAVRHSAKIFFLKYFAECP